MEQSQQGTDERIAAEVMSKPVGERSAYLETACYGNQELRDRVNAIVTRLEGVTLGHEPSTADRPVGLLEGGKMGEGLGTKIGHYKLLQLIGEGGFGSVYMAEQLYPVRRKVALKIIKLGMDTRQVIARFEAERQALAMMDHPNIAKVLDAGATETGRPYFVMELVKGVPITEYCDKNNVSTRERLDLFVQVCRAVQHAHQKGIIHRDIKPSNILVTMADGIPIPKVIDFGIAKATQNPLTDKTLFTEYRALVGTPEYMSPEQAEMAGIDIDTRSDIYSLGVLLYELLTGTTPFDAKELRSKGAPEIQRIIREVDPPKPSTRLSSLATVVEVAHHRSTEPAKLNRIVRGELDWIVMRCLEKDRTRRYETANMLASDITRYLRDEPIAAGPPGTTYQLRKLARRYKWPLAMAGVLAAALVLGIVGTTMGLIKSNAAKKEAQAAEKMALDEKNKTLQLLNEVKTAQALAEENAKTAQRQTSKARTMSYFVQSLLSGRNEAGGSGRDVRVADLLDVAASEIDAHFKDQPELQIAARSTIGDSYQSLGLYEAAQDQYQKALDLSRKTSGWASVEALTLGGKLGLALANVARGDESLEMAQQTYATAKQTLGADHPVTQNAANSLGLLLYNHADYGGAEKIFRELVAQSKAQSKDGIYPAGSGRFFNNLALLLKDENKLEEAEAMQRKAIEILRGETNSPSGVFGRQGRNLATILAMQKKYIEAEEAYRQTLIDQRTRLGDDHPDTQETIETFCRFLGAMGRSVEGQFLKKSSQEIAERTIDVRRRPREPEVYVARGLAMARFGQFKDAAGDFERAMKLGPTDLTEIHTEDHWAWYMYGATVAYLDDREAYRKHCKKMADNFKKKLFEPLMLDRTAKVCFILPDAVADLSVPLDMSTRAVGMIAQMEQNPERQQLAAWFYMAKGMGEYRAGRFEESVKWIGKSREGLQNAPAGTATDDLFLAMAHLKLGKLPEARMYFQRAKDAIDRLPRAGLADVGQNGVENWLIAQTVYREAKEMFGTGK